MNLSLHEMHDRYNISMRKLRQMAHDGVLKLAGDKKPDVATAMRYYLKKDQPLTVEHCVTLLRKPETYASLLGYERKAKRQIAELGNVAGEALKDSDIRWLDLAGRGDPQSVERMAQWILSILPPQGCRYHYVAVRAVYNCPDYLFAEVYKVLTRAILNARQRPALASRAGSEGRAMIFLPKENNLDL